MSDSANPAAAQGYPCPVCTKNTIETVVTAPSIRGFLLAYQIRMQKVLACKGCARKALLGEAGKSAVIGWFSPTSLIVNPLFIVWNVARSPFVGNNPKGLAKAYQEIGVPAPGESVDIPQILYTMASAMISADGKIEQSEIDAADAIGRAILPEFDSEAFKQCITRFKSLPDIEQNARLLGNVLGDEGRHLVVAYLYQIALADGEVHKKEKNLLGKVATAIYATETRFEDVERMFAKPPAEPAAA